MPQISLASAPDPRRAANAATARTFNELGRSAKALTSAFGQTTKATKAFAAMERTVANANDALRELGRTASSSRGGSSGATAGAAAASGGGGGDSFSLITSGGGTEMLDAFATRISELGTMMRSALQGGFDPIIRNLEFARKEFDVFGGAAIVMFTRIDQQMKRTSYDEFSKKVQSSMGKAGSAIAAVGAVVVTAFNVGPWLAAIQAVAALGGGVILAGAAFRSLRVATTVLQSISSIGGVAGQTLGKMASISFNPVIGSAKLLSKAISGTATQAKSTSGSLSGIGREILMAFGVAGVVYKGTQAVKNFAATGIAGAIHLNETLNKTQVVFGAASKGVIANADAMAFAYGLPKGPILDAASSVGQVLKASGMLEAESAVLSTRLVNLAADVSSIQNVPLAVALEKIQSGLVGEAKPLREFGVLLSEDATRAEALRMGLVKGKGTLDARSATAARASLIERQLAYATGDLAATQFDAANAFRKGEGGLVNFATSIGQIFMPAINVGIGAMNDLLFSVIAVFEQNKPLIESWAAKVKETFDAVGVVVRNLDIVWEMMKIKANESFINIGIGINALMENFSIIGDYLSRNWTTLILDAFKAIGLAVVNLNVNMTAVGVALAKFAANPMGGFKVDWTPLFEGFKPAAEALPELVKPEFISMQAEMDKQANIIAQRETERAAKLAAMGKRGVAPPPIPEAPKVEERKFAGLAEQGSQASASAILKSQYGGASVEPAKETAKNTSKTNDILGRMESMMRSGKDPLSSFDNPIEARL